MKYKERNQIPSQNIKYERGVSKYYLENKYLHQQAMYSAILADRGYIKKEFIIPQPNLLPDIKNVIFNDPVTVVFWEDGTKTVVKAQNEAFDPEKGLAMAVTKKGFGNKGKYFETVKKWMERVKEDLNDGKE
jgi:hypothetical protein|nr:MAG TPA: hypothetical protein [Caudoviricetes sp.]